MTNTCASRAANRLVSSTRDNSTIEPIYNGVGDHVGQTVGLSTTNYALDVAAGLPEVIYTTEGNAYLHLPGVIMAESAGGDARYLLSDGLGSVRQAVDESGALVAYHEFDPYGNPTDNGSLITDYGYTGEWWQDDLDLLFLRARWYQPGTGTFLSVDPVESEPPYQYVRGNVVNLVDPSGNTPFPRSAVGTKFMYSCNCGWIDFGGHASSKLGLIKRIERGLSEVDNYQVAWVPIGGSKVKGQVAIHKPAAQGEDNFKAISLGIYISQANAGEWIQGTSVQPWFAQSAFSNEDLVSNLIGFHRGVYEFENGLSENSDQSKREIMRICGVVGREYYELDQKSKFKQIQQDVHRDAFGSLLWGVRAFGLSKSTKWGERPLDMWTGYVTENSTCIQYGCERSSSSSNLLPDELRSIQPKPPLDGWAWAPGVEFPKLNIPTVGRGNTPLIDTSSHPALQEGSMLFLNPTSSKFSGGHYLNSLPLNWGG